MRLVDNSIPPPAFKTYEVVLRNGKRLMVTAESYYLYEGGYVFLDVPHAVMHRYAKAGDIGSLPAIAEFDLESVAYISVLGIVNNFRPGRKKKA